MSLIEGYRKNVRTITVTDQTFLEKIANYWLKCPGIRFFWAENPIYTGPFWPGIGVFQLASLEIAAKSGETRANRANYWL